MQASLHLNFTNMNLTQICLTLEPASHMEKGYNGIKNQGSIWTYDLTQHLMVNLEECNCICTMTFQFGMTFFEIHPIDENAFYDFTMLNS